MRYFGSYTTGIGQVYVRDNILGPQRLNTSCAFNMESCTVVLLSFH